MENLFVVITVARQIQGEYVFIRSERCFKSENKARELMNKLKLQYSKDNVSTPVNIMTPHGEISCNCEIGVFEVPLEN